MVTLPRFYPILDSIAGTRAGFSLRDAAAAMLDAGVRILQLRHKGQYSREMFETAEAISVACARAGATFVINDRADMAALLDAALHLGQEDLPVDDARKLCPRAVIGFSTHNKAQLLAAAGEPADYFALGPIFGTASKENPDPVVGIEELRRLRPLSAKPLVAIGGITRANAAEVLAAGADSLAIIGDLYSGLATAAALRARCEEWLRF